MNSLITTKRLPLSLPRKLCILFVTYHCRKIEGCEEAPPMSHLFQGALNLWSGVFFLPYRRTNWSQVRGHWVSPSFSHCYLKPSRKVFLLWKLSPWWMAWSCQNCCCLRMSSKEVESNLNTFILANYHNYMIIINDNYLLCFGCVWVCFHKCFSFIAQRPLLHISN